jgi:hypothetical protein
MNGVAKYGKFAHLEKALHGTWRASPATTYLHAGLTAAQQDNELKKDDLLPPTTKIGIPTPTGMHYTSPLERVQRTMEIRNFYMSSLTRCVDDSEPRFMDFGDARLLIHDRPAFSERVGKAAKVARPNWHSFFALVHYFDPNIGYPDYLPGDRPEMRDTLPWRLKENRYAWQQEWRFCWLPDTELVGALSPIELAIGSLSDIAVLESLKPTHGSTP